MLRLISSNDKDIYITLAREFYHSPAVLHPVPDEFFIATFNEAMRSDVYLSIYMLEYNSEVVGYALINKTFQQEAGGLVIWVDEIYVRPDYRSYGLGKEFFAHILSLGVPRIRLEVEANNAKAIKLYQNLGFKPLDYLQFIYGN